MRAIDHGAGGTAECLKLIDMPIPSAGFGELLIKVHAAGVNRPDILQREGRYPPPIDASPLLGLEVAGTVSACGEGVTGWALGDFVTALAPGGGYAEYCTVPAGCALPVPSGMDGVSAAALPETWFTVWANLVELAMLQPGERLLVHGGSSGIGLCAIQLATLLGVECSVTVGSDEKARFCEAFGAAKAINYKNADFLEAAKEIGGVDVILDMVGAPYFQRNLAALRQDGRLVYVAFLSGSRGDLDLMPLMRKRLRVLGSTLRPRSLAEKTRLRDSLLLNVWPAIADGRIRPHIHAQFPLERAAEAHRLMESSTHIGKIVLTLN